MKTCVSDLVGRLDVEQPEKQKEFTCDPAVYEQLLCLLGNHLNDLPDNCKIGDLEKSISKSLVSIRDAGHASYRFATLSPQYLINLAPHCYKLLSHNKTLAVAAHASLLSELMAHHAQLSVHVQKPLRLFGANFKTYQPNPCNLTVKGTLGSRAFEEMQDGTVLVNGSVGKYCARRMASGSITIKRNAGDYLGNEMKGGTIVVHGTVGTSIGCDASGGNIHIFGGQKPHVFFECRARVYFRGERIK